MDAKTRYSQIKAADDAEWDDLPLAQKHQFTELFEKGGDASPIGQMIASGEEPEAEPEVAPAPVKQTKKKK